MRATRRRAMVGAVTSLAGLVLGTVALWTVSRAEHTSFTLPVLHRPNGEVVLQAQPAQASCGTAVGRWLGDQPHIPELDPAHTDVDASSFNRELRAWYDACQWDATQRAATAVVAGVAVVLLGVGARLLPPARTEPVPDPY